MMVHQQGMFTLLITLLFINNNFSDDSKQVQQLKDELAELYKKRSQNDQLLIDAQKKIGDLEVNLSIVLDAKAKLDTQLKEARKQLREKEQKLRDFQQEKDALSDEVITLHVSLIIFYHT